jgi:hypothetical protein
LTHLLVILQRANYFVICLPCFFSFSNNTGKHTLLLPQKFTLRLRILTNNMSQSISANWSTKKHSSQPFGSTVRHVCCFRRHQFEYSTSFINTPKKKTTDGLAQSEFGKYAVRIGIRRASHCCIFPSVLFDVYQHLPGYRIRYSDKATGLMTEQSWLNSWHKQEMYLLPSVPMGSRAHQTSYSMGPGTFSPGLKRQRRVTDNLPHQVPRLRMTELYLYSIRFHDVHRDTFTQVTATSFHRNIQTNYTSIPSKLTICNFRETLSLNRRKPDR